MKIIYEGIGFFQSIAWKELCQPLYRLGDYLILAHYLLNTGRHFDFIDKKTLG